MVKKYVEIRGRIEEVNLEKSDILSNYLKIINRLSDIFGKMIIADSEISNIEKGKGMIWANIFTL